MKDNFLLKKNQQEIFESLSNEDAGLLIKGIFSYVNTGNSNLNGLLNAVFIPIKNEIDKNEERYKAICERNKNNGSNGGRPKKNDDENTEKNEKPKETEKNPVGYFGKNTHISYITYHKSKDNNLEKIGCGEEKPLVADEDGLLLETTKAILTHLNKITGANFRSSSKTTQAKINARLNEGYNLDDFIVVIDKKWNEWKDTEFERYMCPDTLFGTKFEKYLNQKNVKKETTEKEDAVLEVLKGVYDGKIGVN